jgi:YD repeat-containing protein
MVFTGYGAEATAYTNSTGQALTDQLIGGLRIKKMITKDQLTNASTTTEYDYSENNVSSGILYGRPTYVQVVRNDELKTFGWYTSTTDQSTDNKSPNGCLCAETNNGTDNQYSFKSAVTIRPMEVTQGGHIGYSTVTVRKVGNGKTVFKFFGQEPWVINRHDIVNRNLNNSFCDPTVPGFPFIPLKEDYRRGATKSEWVFDENGTWLSSKNYELEYTETIESTPAVIVASAAAASGISIFGGNGTNNAMLGSYYHLKTAKKTHYKETTILYPSMTNPIITEATSFFESPYHTQQTKLLTYDSKGVPKQTVVKSTYTSAAQTAWTNAQIAVGSCVTNGCKWNALHTYRITLKNARQQYLNTMAANFTNSNSSFNTIFNNYYATASNTLKAIMQLQKGKMLYPIEGREIVGDIVVNAYFNEFSISTESPNRVYPTKLYTLKESKPTTQFAMATHDNYSISKDPGYEVEAISTYVSGNVVESVSKNGVTTSYLWGYNNSFPIAKAIGASYSNLNAAYIQNNNLLTGLKNQPILSTAQVTTYTYAPLIGMTTQTDPNGRTTYYEYDPFNRLKLIKDQNGNIVKQFCYNYANQPINCYTTDYKNIEAYSGQFTRNNCPAGYTGSTVTYTVPANTVTSSISQADANAKAQQKVQQEGQAYANANGTCTPTPTCNESVCMASGPEYRCVNGVCEVGFKVYTASVYVGGMYECYYRYEWSDGYWADGYMEISPYACLLSVIY